jgi:hypothetical protein
LTSLRSCVVSVLIASPPPRIIVKGCGYPRSGLAERDDLSVEQGDA